MRRGAGGLLAALMLVALTPPLAASAATGDDISSAIPLSVGSSANDVVDAAMDVNDVFAVTLSQGQEVTFKAAPTSARSYDYTVHVLAPGSMSVTREDYYKEVAYGYGSGSEYDWGADTAQFDYVPATTGKYYVWIEATDGNAPYSLSVTRTLRPAITTTDANNIPGIPMGAGSAQGVGDAVTDPNDIYATRLTEGRPMSITVKPTGLWGSDFTVHLLAPGSFSVDRDTYYTELDYAYGSGSEYDWGADEAVIDFTPSKTANYFIWIETTDGNAPYQITMSGTAQVPPPAPKASFVKYQNPIAYDLKSLLQTRFYTQVDQSNVTAELTVKCPTGTKTIYKGTIPTANTTFWFPVWNGMGPDGQRLPSAVYDWQLRLGKDGFNRYYTGKISVSRIYFSLSGTSSNGSAVHQQGYMVPGNANVYVSAGSSYASDALKSVLKGPSSYSATIGNWSFGSASPLSKTAYMRDTAAPKARGLYDFYTTGTHKVSYKMTVIQ